MNGRGKYFNAINFHREIGPLVAWLSGQGPHFFAGGSWGATAFKPRRHYSLCFFFLSSFFYPLAFYCLFSLLNPLASGDFCENVFLVVNTIVNSYCPAYNSIFANCVNKETVTCCMKFIQFISSIIIFACVVLNLNIVLLLPLIYRKNSCISRTRV